MGQEVKSPPFVLSDYTNKDSDNNNLLKSHAYKAVTAGYVKGFVSLSGTGQYIRGYVGPTSDPAGAGTLIDSHSQDTTGNVINVDFNVAKGRYFEIITSSSNAVTINWASYGPLKEPIDYD